jgi:hypothetical protein
MGVAVDFSEHAATPGIIRKHRRSLPDDQSFQAPQTKDAEAASQTLRDAHRALESTPSVGFSFEQSWALRIPEDRALGRR